MNKNGKLTKASWIAYTYVGTVVGAGFASGQEIMGFFTIYGPNSLWAILLSFILFVLIGTRILTLGMELKASSFKRLIDSAFGFLSPFVNIFLLFSMMVINTAMLAGAGAMFEEYGNISHLIGVAVTALVAITTIGFGIRGILSVNKIIVVAILISQLLVFFISMFSKGSFEGQRSFVDISAIHYIIQGVSYASFNLILCTGVLANLGNEYRDKQVLRMGGLMGGCILGAMLLSTHYCLLVHIPEIFDYEIPMLYIISKGPRIFSFIYALVIWGAIFTTLIGNLFSMTTFFYDRFGINQIVSATIIISLGSLLSTLGFSSIINTLYPIVGSIGVIFIIIILLPRKKLNC